MGEEKESTGKENDGSQANADGQQAEPEKNMMAYGSKIGIGGLLWSLQPHKTSIQGNTEGGDFIKQFHN